MKVFENEVLMSVIRLNGDDLRLFVSVTLSISEVPFLSQSSYRFL